MRTTITAGNKTYVVSPDNPLPPEARFRAFVVGQALDRSSAQPLAVPVSVKVSEPGFNVQVKSDNWFVIAGTLREQFPLLATQAYNIHLTLSALGYNSLPVVVTVPQTPATQTPQLVKLPALNTKMQRLP